MKMKVTLGGDCRPGAAGGGRVRNLRPAPRASRPARVGFALLLAALAFLVAQSLAGAQGQTVRATVPEGGSVMVNIELRSRVTGGRNWNASCTGSKISIRPASGRVTVYNSWRPYPFTVTSVEDSDLDDDTATCTVVGSPSSNFDADTLIVTQTDNDKPTAVPSTNDVRVREGGSATVRVRLNGQPDADVTINITKRPGGPVSLSPTTLEFTTANWSTLQTVRLTGPSEQSGEQVWPVTHFDLRNLADGTLALLRARVDDTDAGALERERIERQTGELWDEYYGADTTNPGPPQDRVRNPHQRP